jgi:hypothetical protein
MMEKPPDQPPAPSPEELQTQEEEARYQAWMDAHPETVVGPEALRNCEAEVAEFEAMIASYEATYSLTELHAITDLTPAEAPFHPIREPARVALAPIFALREKIKNETNISPKRYQEINALWQKISMAVGLINLKNKVDHDR